MFRAPGVALRSDEWLTLQTPAIETLYGGQFTISTQLIKPNYFVTLPTDGAPQFFLETYPRYDFVLLLLQGRLF